MVPNQLIVDKAITRGNQCLPKSKEKRKKENKKILAGPILTHRTKLPETTPKVCRCGIDRGIGSRQNDTSRSDAAIAVSVAAVSVIL